MRMGWKRVMIITDDAAECSLRRLLAGGGYDVICLSPKEFFPEVAREMRPDVILLAVDPIDKFRSFLEKIRNIPGIMNVPVVSMPQYCRREKTEPQGIDDLLRYFKRLLFPLDRQGND
jgi:hypothetical protein